MARSLLRRLDRTLTNGRVNPDSQQVALLRIFLVIVTTMIMSLSAAGSSMAQESDRVQLGIKPVGINGSYVDLTMTPGESMQVTVEIGNFGTRDAVASVYPADVYSLVNGGMGVRLADEPTNGTTQWVSFRTETVSLPSAEAQLRTFAVSVPGTASPGEYITSVVIQDATPVESAQPDTVGAHRVNRQAIAIAITVPGPIAPALMLGDIKHKVAGGRSVITVDVTNDGNVRLQPSGELILSDALGIDQGRFPVVMDSVYAGTSTVAEIAFSTLLIPGDYIVVLSLTDTKHDVVVRTPSQPLTIPVSSVLVSPPASAAFLAAAITTTPEDDTWGLSTLRLDLGTSAPLAAAVMLGVVTLIWGGIATARRPDRQLSRTGVAPATTAIATTATPVSYVARPATIRQLKVPRRQHSAGSDETSANGPPRFKKLNATEPGSRTTESSRSRNVKGV